MTELEVKLADGLNVRQIAAVYGAAGRVHIGGVLPGECAARAYRSLENEIPWQLHFNQGEKAFDVSEQHVNDLPEASRRAIYDEVYRTAQSGFQYLFCNFPLSDVHSSGEYANLYAMRVYEFLNSEAFLNFARTVTGAPGIALADAQATLYRPGHFLTQHDDLAPDKHRVAAYVLNLTPHWRTDWGGILQFIDSDGHISEGYVPAFNALNVFKVPQRHSVSYVTPFARSGRFSITGWLRCG